MGDKPEDQTKQPTSQVSRRKFLKIGAAAVAAAAVVGVGGYEYLQYQTSSSKEKNVKIGAVLSLTGPFTGFGQGLQFGHQQAIADINAQGGININGKKVPIEYIVVDDTSDPTKAASLASQLILNDNVDLLVQGCMPPTTVNPISSTADRYSTPFIGGAPFEPWWAGGPYKYCWSILFRIGTPPAGISELGYTILDISFAATNPYKSQTNSVVAVLAADDADGRGWYGIFPGALSKAGYTSLTSGNLGLYPPGTSDFSSMISQWINNKAEIMWANLPGPDFGIAWRQCKELGFKPKIVYAARAALFYNDVNSWGGDLPQGVGTEVWWDPSYPYKGIGNTTPQSLATAWTSKTSNPLNRNIGFGYTAIQIAADAITRAGTLDKNAVNTAIGQTNGMFMTGPIKFYSDTHDSPTALAYGQWFKTTNPEVWDCDIVIQQHPNLPPPTQRYLFPLP